MNNLNQDNSSAVKPPKIDTGGNQGRDYDHTPLDGPLLLGVVALMWVVVLGLGAVLWAMFAG